MTNIMPGGFWWWGVDIFFSRPSCNSTTGSFPHLESGLQSTGIPRNLIEYSQKWSTTGESEKLDDCLPLNFLSNHTKLLGGKVNTELWKNASLYKSENLSFRWKILIDFEWICNLVAFLVILKQMIFNLHIFHIKCLRK